MSPGRIEATVWVLLYGGLTLLMVGLWSHGGAGPWPHILIAGGLALAAAGVLLIWLRSRLPDTDSDRDSRKTDR